jgi:hypothetical protein
MRVKVRAIEPRADDATLDELIAEPAPEHDLPAPGGPGTGTTPPGPGPAVGAGAEVHLVTHPRRVTASDLGPNGEEVLDLLARAARLTPAECRSLEKEAGWRWWMMTPLAGATLPAARANALVIGRAEGRSDPIAALQTAVAAIVTSVVGPKAGRSRVPACISNAGLALLVRDLIEPEAFELLTGPWREVMRD